MINTNFGLKIGNLQMPAILLTDDTTVLRSTKYGLQALLNWVNDYAYTCKLKYNAAKRNCLVFKSLKESSNHTELDFILGDIKIPNSRSVTYTGTLIDSELFCTNRKCMQKTETKSTFFIPCKSK